MRVHIAANYQGYALGRALESSLTTSGHEVLWHGAADFDENDDYPVYAIRAGQAVVADEDTGEHTMGIVIGSTGAAEVIAVNKVPGARAVLAETAEVIADARAHANANILVLGADRVDEQCALALVSAFQSTPFANLLDDARRVINVAEFEASGTIEGWMIDFTSGNSGLQKDGKP